MAKIVAEHLIPGFVKKNDTSSGAKRAYDDHWQRVFEQAHLDRQVSAMHSTGPHPIKTEGAHNPGESPNISEVSGGLSYSANSATGSGILHGAPVDSNSAAAPGRAMLQASSSVNAASFVPVGGGACPTPSGGPAIGARGANAAAVSGSALRFIQSQTPPTSSVTAMATDEGIHVVIRDTALSAQDAKRLIAKLQSLLDSENQGLFAVTLNGHQIWTHTPTTRPETPSGDMTGIPEIDKRY